MGLGLTLTEALLAQLPAPGRLPGAGSWEVGRLALAPAYRSDPDALKRCLFLALDYLSSQERADDLYAACSHVLSRLYRRFGFSSFASDVPLPGTDKRYTLIHGRGPDVLKALAPVRQVEASCST